MRRLLVVLPFFIVSAQAAQLTVFAASSLTDAFTEMGKAFERQSGHRTRFNFAGSQVLRTQLSQGAGADVFASANVAQYTPLVKAGLLQPGKIFARNQLVLIVPASNRSVRKLGDLASPGLKLVLAAPGVPAGDATRAVLKRLDMTRTYGPTSSQKVLKNVVSQEPNVRQAALKVQLGQADAAFIYRSDLTPGLRKAVKLLELPTPLNPPVAYPIGVLKKSRNAAAAQEFVKFIHSSEGQRILRKWGFLGQL